MCHCGAGCPGSGSCVLCEGVDVVGYIWELSVLSAILLSCCESKTNIKITLVI